MQQEIRSHPLETFGAGIQALGRSLADRILFLELSYATGAPVIHGWYQSRDDRVEMLAPLPKGIEDELLQYAKPFDPKLQMLKLTISEAQSVAVAIFVKSQDEIAADLKSARIAKLPPREPNMSDEERMRLPFGRKLAEKVAESLLQSPLQYAHRDYCGMGLLRELDTIYYGEIWEGELDKAKARAFTTTDFIAWIADQSDQSLAREGEDFFAWNQTINYDRLATFSA